MAVYKIKPLENGGGSGATYTAGNGIAITNENVINADIKVLEVSNITTLTTEQCNSLNAGDVVVKLTSNQKHTYTVSYKEAGVGMCLTYVDASTSETVSYDYTGGQWVYNSTDITPLIPTIPHLYLYRFNVSDMYVSFYSSKLYSFETNHEYQINSDEDYKTCILTGDLLQSLKDLLTDLPRYTCSLVSDNKSYLTTSSDIYVELEDVEQFILSNYNNVLTTDSTGYEDVIYLNIYEV